MLTDDTIVCEFIDIIRTYCIYALQTADVAEK